MAKVSGKTLTSSVRGKLLKTLRQQPDLPTLTDTRPNSLRTGNRPKASNLNSEKTTRYSFTLANGRKIVV